MFQVYVLCTVACQRFSFHVGMVLCSYFCGPRILPRMRSIPWDPLHLRPLRISSHKYRRRALHPPHMSAHELRRQNTNTHGLLRSPNTRPRSRQRLLRATHLSSPPLPAAFPNTHSRRRPYRRRRQFAQPDARPEHAPPVFSTLAAEHKQVSASVARRPPQRAQTTPATETQAAARPAKWPPMAAQTPAETHECPAPPDAPVAGLAAAGGGPVAASCLPHPPPLPPRRATAGHTDAGSNPTLPMPATHVRRRCRQHRRRGSHFQLMTPFTAHPDTQLRHFSYKRQRCQPPPLPAPHDGLSNAGGGSAAINAGSVAAPSSAGGGVRQPGHLLVYCRQGGRRLKTRRLCRCQGRQRDGSTSKRSPSDDSVEGKKKRAQQGKTFYTST